MSTKKIESITPVTDKIIEEIEKVSPQAYALIVKKCEYMQKIDDKKE